MPNILEKIAHKTKERIEAKKRAYPLEGLIQQPIPAHPSFYEAIKKKPFAYICEIKKASPSKGVIVDVFDPILIAQQYELAGADAISCLSEPYFFLGSEKYIEAILPYTSLPVLRKDFVLDEYMIYESAVLGVSAILLIVELLEEERLKSFIELCHQLGMDALVETHDEKQIEIALRAGARIIGVNNRDLKNFEVDVEHALRLRKMCDDPSVVFVSESGIQSSIEILALKQAQVDAVLIGETMMKAKDKVQKLKELDAL